ncbi:MAG: hypothetical protein ACP5PQ_04540 [Thermoproteota archaeon]
MQRKEAVYSLGNLLVLIGIVMFTVFTLLPSLVEVSGFLRTGINLVNSLLVFAGSVIPMVLKDMDAGQRMRSIGVRCFTSSFIMSILLTAQMLTRGWASTVPVLASLALALSGIAAYMLSGQGGKIVMPHTREILLFISVLIIFATPMIQLSLLRIGVGVEAARIISISLLIAFTVVLYVSLKVLGRRKESSTSIGGENR